MCSQHKNEEQNGRIFRTVDAKLPDEVTWKEFWRKKTAEEKLNAAEAIIRGNNASQRLKRIFRIVERT